MKAVFGEGDLGGTVGVLSAEDDAVFLAVCTLAESGPKLSRLGRAMFGVEPCREGLGDGPD